MIQLILMVLAIDIQPEYYTNTNYIYDIAGRDSMIYCATNGGFIAYNRLTDVFTTVTNTDGLQKNEQSCVGVDSSGHIWTGNSLGLALVESDLRNTLTYPIECLTCTRTQTIACLTDSVYVGSSNGILFIDTKGTPLDFLDDTQTKIFDIDVSSIAIDDTSIWVGTAADGVIRYSKDGLLHQATYTVNDGLLDNEINVLKIIDGQLYVATDQGVNRFGTDHFDTLLTNYQVNDLSFLGDSLILGLNQTQQIGILYDGNVSIMQNGLPYNSRVECLLNLQGELFSGLGNRFTRNYFGDGIGRYDTSNNIWLLTRNNCLPSNHINEITANENGVFVACGNRGAESRGLGWLTVQDQWTNFTTDSVIPSNYIHRCTTAPDGKVWFGINYLLSVDSIVAFGFDPSNNTWLYIPDGYNGMDNTVAVWDITFDEHNTMYLTLAPSADRLWLIDSTLDVVYYLDPQFSPFNVEIAIDTEGRIWRTLTDAGLLMTNTNGTLFDRTDDAYRNYTTTDGLISNYTRGCVVDRHNILYAATDAGLIIYDGTQFTNRTDISESELMDVEIDSQERIWVLARDGIHYLDPSSGNTYHYRFADNNIDIHFLESIGEMIQVQGFEFDPVRHCFWVGGENGLLKLTVQYDPEVEVGAATIFPNPVTLNTVRIKDIPLDARVDIFTISGRRVANDLIPDSVFGEIVWQIPEDIGSGMYFAVVKSQQGDKTYKFAIVR
ncbi:MAG: T9SS type A sorting domain-containing protein [candidate division WOR-3 bacterium]|nr:MAG: T9SS type A sorting domain-containing protein [candidate division WOR-3 bacterium]